MEIQGIKALLLHAQAVGYRGCKYTRLKKRCRVKSIKDGQRDTMELWEDDRVKFVTRFRFLIFKTFSFQDILTSKLRHAVLL